VATDWLSRVRYASTLYSKVCNLQKCRLELRRHRPPATPRGSSCARHINLMPRGKWEKGGKRWPSAQGITPGKIILNVFIF